MTDIIPDDIVATARKITDGEEGWIGSVVGQQIIARAIMGERARCAKIAREYPFTDIFEAHSNYAVAGNAASNIAAMIDGRLHFIIRVSDE